MSTSDTRLDGPAASLAGRVAEVAQALGKEEAARRLRAEAAVAGSGAATLVVAGETKRGKSSLINALLGRPGLSPVDADVATNAYIVFRHSEHETVTVHRGDGTEADTADVHTLADWASVAGNPENHKGVRMADVGIRSPLLARGLTLVDTPGVGGLQAAHARVTHAALAGADALLFVVDAAAPLAAPELEFLNAVTDRLETVIFAMTKRDLYGGWEEILAENRSNLARHAPRFAHCPFLAVSSLLKLKADELLQAGEEGLAGELLEESSFPPLEAEIEASVTGRAQSLRARNIVQLARTVLGELEASQRIALAGASADPKLTAAHAAARTRAQQFADSKRVGTVALHDELTTLSQDVNLQLHRSLADLRRRYEDAIRAGTLESAGLNRELDADARAVVGELDVMVRDRVAGLAQRLQDELDVALAVDLDELEPPKALATVAPPPRTADGLTRLTSYLPALSGLYMPGGIAGALAGAGGVALAGPVSGVLFGAGVVLVGLNVLQRRRAESRQEAYNLVREVLETLRLEIPPVVTRRLREYRRDLETSLEAGIRDRERELKAALDQQQRLAQRDLAARTREKARAQARMTEIGELRRLADEVLGEAARGTVEAAAAAGGRPRQ